MVFAVSLTFCFLHGNLQRVFGYHECANYVWFQLTFQSGFQPCWHMCWCYRCVRICLQARRMISAVLCFSTTHVAQWCLMCYMKLVFQHLLFLIFYRWDQGLTTTWNKLSCPIYTSQLAGWYSWIYDLCVKLVLQCSIPTATMSLALGHKHSKGLQWVCPQTWTPPVA